MCDRNITDPPPKKKLIKKKKKPEEIMNNLQHNTMPFFNPLKGYSVILATFFMIQICGYKQNELTSVISIDYNF